MLRSLLVLFLAALPLAASAQSFRCVGKDGKKYYGSTVPPQCIGQPVEQLDNRGVVMKRFDAAATADERAKKDADDAEMKKRATVAKEQSRKDSALLASYTSEKDIELARTRALEGPQSAAKDAENRIAALKRKRAAPNEDAKGIDTDIRAQEGVLTAKQKEMEIINSRYDEDKKRFVQIKQGK
jgi:hypothetical protein